MNRGLAVFDVSTSIIGGRTRDRLVSPDSRGHDVSGVAADLERHFRENYPIMLDGALPLAADQGRLLRQARESLSRKGAGLPPAALLRETLDAITSRPNPSTSAGLTAIGPGNARVWWDKTLLDNLDDILSGLDRPRPVLRFFDITGLDPDAGRWHESFDVDIALDDRARTVELLKPDRAYIVDLGYLYADGRLLRLARTNTADIPREGRGVAGDGATVRSVLRPRRKADPAVIPDAKAVEFVDGRPDHSARDVASEQLIHMLYRAFLLEGPRALRRAPRPARRDAAVLETEYRRRRSRARKAAARRVKKAAPAFLVTRLGMPAVPAAPVPAAYPPVPASLSPFGAVVRGASIAVERIASLYGVVAAARSGRVPVPGDTGVPVTHSPVPVPDVPLVDCGTGDLVRTADPVIEMPEPMLASPVFEAAEHLRRRLSDMPSLASRSGDAAPGSAKGMPAPSRDFGGVEARRFAKAGVRVTRMALTLEGRMRPGARLKVGGKLVYADADGCFRLECVLTGKRASIPLRAGTSIGGEARSVINVEWENRPSREKKKIEL